MNMDGPQANDVLCGRGKGSYRHNGNKIFHRLVLCNKERYITCKKNRKIEISKSIVDEIRNQNPPGRFLEFDPNLKIWRDIGDKRAVEKASQALREKKIGASSHGSNTSFNSKESFSAIKSSKKNDAWPEITTSSKENQVWQDITTTSNKNHVWPDITTTSNKNHVWPDITTTSKINHAWPGMEIEIDRSSGSADHASSEMEVDYSSSKCTHPVASEMEIDNNIKNNMHNISSLSVSPFISQHREQQHPGQNSSSREERSKVSDLDSLILATLQKDYSVKPCKRKEQNNAVKEESCSEGHPVDQDELNSLIYQTFVLGKDHDENNNRKVASVTSSGIANSDSKKYTFNHAVSDPSAYIRRQLHYESSSRARNVSFSDNVKRSKKESRRLSFNTRAA